MKLNKDTRNELLALFQAKRICLEGNILKVIDSDGTDPEFDEYLVEVKRIDEETRRKRLDITKQIQAQNRQLMTAQADNAKLMDELVAALDDAKKAKAEAEKLRDAAVESLDTFQKKAQFELIGLIVRVALIVILGVGAVTTGLYIFAMVMGYDTKLIESSWSNMFGILLTNSFSIIGTIMGVKYATDQAQANNNPPPPRSNE